MGLFGPILARRRCFLAKSTFPLANTSDNMLLMAWQDLWWHFRFPYCLKVWPQWHTCSWLSEVMGWVKENMWGGNTCWLAQWVSCKHPSFGIDTWSECLTGATFGNCLTQIELDFNFFYGHNLTDDALMVAWQESLFGNQTSKKWFKFDLLLWVFGWEISLPPTSCWGRTNGLA